MLVKELVPNVDLTDGDSFSRVFDLSRKDHRVPFFFFFFFSFFFIFIFFFRLLPLLLLCSKNQQHPSTSVLSFVGFTFEPNT